MDQAGVQDKTAEADVAAGNMASMIQSLTEMMSKFMDSMMSATKSLSESVDKVSGAERDTASGLSRTIEHELDSTHSVGNVESWRQLIVEDGRRSGMMRDRLFSDALDFSKGVQQIMLRTLSEGGETSDMTGKQAIRHADTQMFNTSEGQAALLKVAEGSSFADLMAEMKALNDKVDVFVKGKA